VKQSRQSLLVAQGAACAMRSVAMMRLYTATGSARGVQAKSPAHQLTRTPPLPTIK
jgi:hypothetical protein